MTDFTVKGVVALYISDCILYAMLAYCAATDIGQHRIPNKVIGAGVAAGLACALGGGWAGGTGWGMGAGFPEKAALAAAGFLGRLVLAAAAGFPFFVVRMAGAGDIKLMALITAYMGIDRGLMSIGIGLCIGAVLALARMLRKGSACQRFIYLIAYIRRFIQSRKIEAYYSPERDGYECVIPLGACFSAGTLVMALWKG